MVFTKKKCDRLEVYADIWCPFAHVGLRAAIHERSRLGRDEVKLVIHAWPLELVNGAPLDPRTTARHVADLRSQVAPDLFRGFDEVTFPTTTIPALALASDAYRHDLTVGEAVSLALRDALFEQGLDVSNRDVLGDLASLHDLDLPPLLDDAAVVDEWRRGQQRGVRGSPHFFCGETEAFCPTLDIARDAEVHLLLHRNSEQLSAFLQECLLR